MSGLKCGCCRAGNNAMAPPFHLRALADGARSQLVPPWQPRPPPLPLDTLARSPGSLLLTTASVSSLLVMDDHNNSACLAPWQRGLSELMKACRLHTQGVPPGQPALLSLELAASFLGKELFLMLLRQCKRTPKENRLQGWRHG